MKVVILGASGMAGHVLKVFLEENTNFQVIGTAFSNVFDKSLIKLDVFDLISVEEMLQKHKPDAIINCVGILINQSVKEPEKAIFVNSFFSHFLNKEAKKINAKLIHLSTDCVFSGKNKGNYTENSQKDALDLYGQSKSLGEIIDDNNVLTIRTSIIGPELPKANSEGLFHWFMSQKGEVFGYKKAIWSGVTTLELSKFISYILSKENNLSGLFHLTNNTSISKYELLKLFSKVYNLKNVDIKENNEYEINKSFLNTNQREPYIVPSYEQMIVEQYNFMKNHEELYNHYLLNY